MAILTIGTTGIHATRAVKSLANKEITAAHYDMRFVKPLDEELLHEIFQHFDRVITVEDGVIQGGFGSAVLEFMAAYGYKSKLVRLGVPDRFIEHGTPEELQRDCGFDQKGIYQAALEILQG